ncbi:hypothetical protein SteCoe_6362 [Stentor coeruleus]|uniref:Histidine kinase n=1 Tax=Stentor coeruleus TaxID=5963 RepID=A0A1R2CQ42_9CILI|nr:hypothetical protein SteCoe_6362 [Stentor coeruleus]
MFFDKTTEEGKILESIRVHSAYKRLIIGMWSAIILSSIHLTLELIFNGIFTNFKGKFPIIFVLAYNYYLIGKIHQQSKQVTMVFIMIVTELAQIVSPCLAFAYYPDSLIPYAQLSVLLFVFYQSFMFTNIKILAFFSVKQIVTWGAFGYYYGMITFSDPFPFIIGTSAVCIFYFMTTYCEYLKDVHLCKSKLKVQRMHKNILSIVEAISDSIIVLSKKNEVIFTNTSAKELLSNKPPDDFFSEFKYYRKYNQIKDLQDNLFSNIKELFICSLGDEMNFGIVYKDKELIEWRGKLIEWDNQLSIILCGRNVTHLVKMEKESVENQYKSALLRTVSHELRTPTSAVISITQIIESSNELSKENVERLDIIKNSCTYQLCLINDLLDYAQILSGCLKISKIFFNMNELLLDCLKIISIQLQERNISIELVSNELPETIYSDPYRIKQIILNLLSNARKFTMRGSIVLEAFYTCDTFRIQCMDTGIGISEDKIPLLFKQFGKVEDSVNLNPQGVGLGLVISNMLVKELGGEGITVKSEVGKGSCFSFSIPMQTTSNSSISDIAEENAKVIVPSICTKTIHSKNEILIVDDTYFNIIALVSVLKTEGILCTYAFNGQDALNKVKEKQFSCILMDCEMPVLDGWETTIKIHELFESKEINFIPPIIACTAHTTEVIKIKCTQSGMDDIIVKPCPTEILISKLKYWMLKGQECISS